LYDAKGFHKSLMGSPLMGVPNVGGVCKNCIFDRSRSLQFWCLSTENLCPSARWSASMTMRWHQQFWWRSKF